MTLWPIQNGKTQRFSQAGDWNFTHMFRSCRFIHNSVFGNLKLSWKFFFIKKKHFWLLSPQFSKFSTIPKQEVAVWQPCSICIFCLKPVGSIFKTVLVATCQRPRMPDKLMVLLWKLNRQMFLVSRDLPATIMVGVPKEWVRGREPVADTKIRNATNVRPEKL